MPQDNQSMEYEKAVAGFAAAVEALGAGRLDQARDGFRAVIETVKDEPVLAERARMYLTVCERKGAAAEPTAVGPDELYYRAVIELNNGNTDEAVKLLDQALQHDPTSVKLLYARASAWAVGGNTEAAVSDLRQAIAADPTIRFQAVNDADFERIREEPAFIDIIEPTPTGA